MVLLDLDGVLADWVGGVCERLKVTRPQTHAGNYSIGEILGISNKELFEAIDGHDFWVNLPWMGDGKAILTLVENYFGRENIYIATSPTSDYFACSGKAEWVCKNIPYYRRRTMIGPCKELMANNNSLLIDDADENIKKFVEAGGEAILVPRSWNSFHDIGETAYHFVKQSLEGNYECHRQ